MFGSKRRKAVRVCVQAVYPMLRLYEFKGGIPRGFWRDAYVLGYLNGTMANIARLSMVSKISGEELGLILMEAYQQLAGIEGAHIAEEVLHLIRTEDQDFERGVRNAEKVIAVMFGIPGYEDDPHVQTAKLKAELTSPDVMGSEEPLTEEQSAAMWLQNELFYGKVEARLGGSQGET